MQPIDAATLLAIMPLANARAAQFAGPLGAAMARFGINTPIRAAAFLAQIAHESGQLRYVRELADGKAYEGRKDLGNTEPGDGPRFRGRGLIQVTGRFNYRACSLELFGDERLLDNPELLEFPEYAALSAAWFWAAHGCNEIADTGDFRALTRRINGGYNGLAERTAFWERAERVFRDTQPPAPVEERVISVGDPTASAPEPTPQPAGAPPAPPAKRKTMDPLTLIATFGPMIANLIPQVAKLFSSGSEVATRNVAAASAVFDTVVKAADAANIQQAVEKMQADPALAAKVQEAVVTDPAVMGLLEIGGGIQKAREMNLSLQNADKPFWFNPAFWITMVLLMMPFMLLVDMFYVHPTAYEGNLRTQIVTGVLGIIMMGGAYWLGSSIGSAKKDDRAASASAAEQAK